MPKISIIVPVYKVEQYLCRCLDSIVAQTFADWECILVDDGSPDNSGKICDEYAEKDQRFKVIHKQNEGVAKARITAFENCSGELVTFIDSDDYVSELYLEKMSEYISTYNADMVVCKHYDVNEGNISKGCSILRPVGYYDRSAITKLQAQKLIYDYKLGFPPIIEGLARRIVKKDFLQGALWKSIGYWSGEDAICNFYMYDKINSMYLCDDYLYYYVHRAGAATRSHPIKLWNGTYDMYKEIININHKGLYDKQLFGRLIYTIKLCLFNSLPLSYREIKELVITIQNSEYVKKMLIENKVQDLYLRKDKFVFYFLKFKLLHLKCLALKLLPLYRKIFRRKL